MLPPEEPFFFGRHGQPPFGDEKDPLSGSLPDWQGENSATELEGWQGDRKRVGIPARKASASHNCQHHIRPEETSSLVGLDAVEPDGDTQAVVERPDLLLGAARRGR